ncbi:MAG: hypothetical protein BWY15_01662 [Firmicutes bacterium ADurb.Bin193]|nr:MAG: hypothetical protein BWY15_01662 [Firmicutes bacterium ADurb.Bin193]
MNELNMSSYIQTMQPGLMTHDKQESAGVFLLSSINDQEYVGLNGYRTDNLSSKKISRLVSRADHVPDGIKQASTKQVVIDETIKYFKNQVWKDLNPHLMDDTINDVVKLISVDPTIPDSKKKSLIEFHTSGDDPRFLAEAFLYAVNRPNKKVDDVVEYEDAPLLAEANYECPLCHKKLVDTVKNQAVKRYRITQIFPDDLDDEFTAMFSAACQAPSRLDVPENLIALDEECSDRYLLSPTVDEYKKLREIKDSISRNYAAKSAVNCVQLEDDIRTVLDALSQIRDASELVQLEYDALHIEEKFKPENFILKNETQLQVVTYYRYIEKVFSESDADFDIIASEIKVSSQKLEKAGMSQAEVMAQLSEWIRNKSGLGADGQLACNIVVSFFIQNCEVFHK